MKRRQRAATPQQQEAKAKRKKTREIECMQVFGNKAFFNNYLREQIGAPWQQIKNSLYDAGYTTEEVNAYRDGLLEDFRDVCDRNHIHGII